MEEDELEGCLDSEKEEEEDSEDVEDERAKERLDFEDEDRGRCEVVADKVEEDDDLDLIFVGDDDDDEEGEATGLTCGGVYRCFNGDVKAECAPARSPSLPGIRTTTEGIEVGDPDLRGFIPRSPP